MGLNFSRSTSRKRGAGLPRGQVGSRMRGNERRCGGSENEIMTETMHVSIWRGGADGAYVDYEVPRVESQTVLDVVTYVQRQVHPSLAYRFPCPAAGCASR